MQLFANDFHILTAVLNILHEKYLPALKFDTPLDLYPDTSTIGLTYIYTKEKFVNNYFGWIILIMAQGVGAAVCQHPAEPERRGPQIIQKIQ